MKPKSLVTLATAGITLFGMGFWFGSNLAFKREEAKNLEQIVVPQEPLQPVREFYNNDLTNEEKERIFYVSALEILDNVSNGIMNFNNNLNSYANQTKNKIRFLYLAQAKENLITVDQSISLMQKIADGDQFVSKKFVQTLCNIQYSHQELVRNYLDELESVFTREGVSNYQVNVAKFCAKQNKNAKDLERELSSAINQAESKIENW